MPKRLARVNRVFAAASLTIDGVTITCEVVGDLTVDGDVLITRSGVLRGNLQAARATVAGQLHGDITCDWLGLDNTALVCGAVVARTIDVIPGAQVNATLMIGDAARRGPENPPEAGVAR